MKSKGINKFIKFFKTTRTVVGDDDGLSLKETKCKGRDIRDDLDHQNIFVSSNSYDGEERKPKRKYKKFPRFLKEVKNKLMSILKGKPSFQSPRDGEVFAQFKRNSSDSSSSSVFTSSSMASSSLASTCSYGSDPTKLKSSLAMKRTYPNDHEHATIEAQNNMNSNINKQDLMEKAGGCYFGSEYGICFIMLGLLALLTWGKVIAVFFTSLCLYSATPRRLKVIHSNPQDILDDTMMIIEVPESQVTMEDKFT